MADCQINGHIARAVLFRAEDLFLTFNTAGDSSRGICEDSSRGLSDVSHSVGGKLLTVFFSGWATDGSLMGVLFPEGAGVGSPKEVAGVCSPEGAGDVLLVYGHQDFVLPRKLLEGYSRFRLVAWSLGVWAAEAAVGLEDIPWEECVAVNGTPCPVDDDFGIPYAIYKGTLDNLSHTQESVCQRNLYKFRLRMCGGGDNFRRFMACPPERDMADIREELRSILVRSRTSDWSHLSWTKAVVCSSDAIFPPANQISLWRRKNLEPVMVEAPHFVPELLKELLIFVP